MITVDELREAIEKGFIKGKTVSVVRRNNQIHDYVLPGEKVDPGKLSKKNI